MKKGKATASKARETVGGYPAGDRLLISEFPPPPPGPAPGAKRPSGDSQKK